MDRPHDDVQPSELARLATEAHVREGSILDPPRNAQGVLAEQAGVFVTLHTEDGHLRGCIGTISASRDSVAEEIIQNAISAATRDPRFPPVSVDELPHLRYGVDVLDPAQPAAGIEDLDPSVYGVIIETLDGSRRALLLPRIEGIETPVEQWSAVHMKAGIAIGTPIRLERFTVRRFGKD